MRIIKPWGYEIVLEQNEKYVVKELFMRSGCRCSLQYHDIKCETIYVVRGVLRIYLEHNAGSNIIFLHPGSCMTIKPKEVHRMMAIKDCVYLETSTPEIDDVKRLDDDYGRE